MKIGIIGAGYIGGSLGALWSARGHDVVYGVRDPQSAKTKAALAESGPNARAVGLKEAAAFGEVVVIAIPANAIPDTLPQLGDLRGKVVIDATNDVRHARPGDAPSMSIYVARQLPGAHVVKAFNTMTFETIRNPRFSGDVNATVFLCGDDAQAKATVMGLASELGLDTADLGSLEQAPLMDTMLMVFFAASQNYGRGIAFRLLRR